MKQLNNGIACHALLQITGNVRYFSLRLFAVLTNMGADLFGHNDRDRQGNESNDRKCNIDPDH